VCNSQWTEIFTSGGGRRKRRSNIMCAKQKATYAELLTRLLMFFDTSSSFYTCKLSASWNYFFPSLLNLLSERTLQIINPVVLGHNYEQFELQFICMTVLAGVVALCLRCIEYNCLVLIFIAFILSWQSGSEMVTSYRSCKLAGLVRQVQSPEK
jgi:hypothetical protein